MYCDRFGFRFRFVISSLDGRWQAEAGGEMMASITAPSIRCVVVHQYINHAVLLFICYTIHSFIMNVVYICVLVGWFLLVCVYACVCVFLRSPSVCQVGEDFLALLLPELDVHIRQDRPKRCSLFCFLYS